jgi:hypothetical protein
MNSIRKSARVAGFLYPLMGGPFVFTFMYVLPTLIVPSNATATANNILAHETLFRVGILGELLSAVAFIFLVMALYRLLSGVNKTHASLMVGFVLVSVAITFVNVLNSIAALILFRGADFLVVFDKRQLDALAMFFLRLHGQGFAVNDIFWGLWLFPFGVLVMRSGFLPRLIGILLIVNCFAYLAISLTSLLMPSYGPVVFRIAMPALLGELWIMLWLLIKGAKVQPLAAAAS